MYNFSQNKHATRPGCLMWGMREKSGCTTKQEQLEHNIKANVKFGTFRRQINLL